MVEAGHLRQVRERLGRKAVVEQAVQHRIHHARLALAWKLAPQREEHPFGIAAIADQLLAMESVHGKINDALQAIIDAQDGGPTGDSAP